MNTFDFFNDNFGKLLSQQGNDPYENAANALSSNHARPEGSDTRIMSGWAIVSKGQAVMQYELAAEGIKYDTRTRYEAIYEALENWDEQPILFMTFTNKPLPIANLFLTIDLRAVRICEPSGVSTFDYTKEPTETSPQFYKTLYNQRMENAS
jgi:hypothetical protein